MYKETYTMISQDIPTDSIRRVSIGHGADTCRLAMDSARPIFIYI